MPAPQKPVKRLPKPRKPLKRSSKPIARRSRPAAVRRTSSGKAKHSADLAWAKTVRAKGPCFALGKVYPAFRDGGLWRHSFCQGQIQACHIHSRRYLATRTDERNGVPMCAFMHDWFTARPKDWETWISDQIGPELYEELRQKAMRGPKSNESEAA